MSSPWELTLNQQQVNRLIWMIHQVGEQSWEGTRRLLVERWEARANEAAAEGLSSALMWAELGRRALSAKPLSLEKERI